MKTVKPLRMSLMSRPFMHDGRSFLAVTAMAMIAMDEACTLVPETEMWQVFTQALGESATVDLCMPKRYPEYLVSGRAYAEPGVPQPQCAVEVQLGPHRKMLLVSGDRYWLNGQSTQAIPFQSQEMEWANSFGGAGDPRNPLGRGIGTELIQGLYVRRLPNVESAAQLWIREGHPPSGPAGFGPIAPDNAVRMTKFGKNYDEKWKETLFPGFASDMDWSYFNAAQSDQWGAADEDWAGQSYMLKNLHPTRRQIAGRLPDWIGRAFIVRQEIPNARDYATGRLDEISLKLSTAWFFPDRERIALIYHGTFVVTEDDGADISHLMAALEYVPPGAQRQPLTVYEEVLQSRIDPEWGALSMLRDEQLLPAQAVTAWVDLNEEAEEFDALARNLTARADALREQVAQERARHGLPPVDLSEGEDSESLDLTRLPDIQDLPAYFRKLTAYAEKKQVQMDAQRQDFEQRHAAQVVRANMSPEQVAATIGLSDGPSTFARLQATLAFARVNAPNSTMDKLQPVIESGMQGARKVYKMSAQYQQPAYELQGEAAAQVRSKVQAKLESDRNLSDLDLTGADLSGMDLRHINLRGALLERANLSRAILDDSDLSEALLVRANLSGASLQRTRMTDTNLSLAICEKTRFDSVVFKDAVLDGGTFASCVFTRCHWEQVQVMNVLFTNCDFLGASFSFVTAVGKSGFVDCRFDSAKLEKFALLEAAMTRCSFVDAVLSSCSFYELRTPTGNDFSRASLTTTSFLGEAVRLVGIIFRDATLKECSLRDMVLDDADFSRAVLGASDFSGASMKRLTMTDADARSALFVRTDLSNAVLSRTDFSEAVLQKATLHAANLVQANLFRADVAQVRMNAKTMLDGAHVNLAKTWPRSEGTPS